MANHDFDRWRSAAPEGQRLVAAAPMVGNWVPRPRLIQLVGQIPLLLWLASEPLSWVLRVIILFIAMAATVAVIFGWKRRWRRHHPPPSGMAAVLKVRRRRGLVLIVTESAVLMTETKASPRFSGVRPAGVGRPIPGLTAIDAVDDLLIVSFADGSEALLRQSAPQRGTEAAVGDEVADLAAAALSRAEMAPRRN